MIQTIVLLVVLAVLFLTRRFWLGFIVGFFDKRKKNFALEVKQFQIPLGLKRTFVVSIDITEGGDGTALIEITKQKEPKK